MVSCFFLKASQALLKVGLHSIFMKLALCEIGFCLMDPCMGALPDTPASTQTRGWRTTGSGKQGGKKRGQDCYYNDAVLKTSVQEIVSIGSTVAVKLPPPTY